MQDRFTDKANEVLKRAAIIAREFGHGYVGTEHILIGLLDAGDNVASMVLNNHGVDQEKLDDMVEQLRVPESTANVVD